MTSGGRIYSSLGVAEPGQRLAELHFFRISLSIATSTGDDMAKTPKFELKQMIEQLSQQLVDVDRSARARGDAILQLDECEVQL